MGGDYPIRIQSMTTTDTMDTEATVAQTIRLIEAGCDYVRITAPSMNEARNLEEIKKHIRAAGFNTPLIADIHFTPNAAELAARIVEKVRVNPGNYADKKKFQQIEYSDGQYEAELERIRDKFTPLVKICKEYGTAMRIGTNHGSLSDRIMSRYGDTPLGMVESALEFLRICEDNNYYEIVLSMKASNPKVMVQAYRLLVQKMREEEMNYPLHLGVTEAGDGEDGRIKSAVGIGTLLEDGLGDTIRVSLTEEPEAEVPVAKELANRYLNRQGAFIPPVEKINFDPYSYNKRQSASAGAVGGEHVPVVVADLRDLPKNNPLELKAFGYEYDVLLDKWHINDMAADLLFLGDEDINYEIPGTLKKVFNYSEWKIKKEGLPIFTAEEYLRSDEIINTSHFVLLNNLSRTSVGIPNLSETFIGKIKKNPSAILILQTDNEHAMAELRRAFLLFDEMNIPNPVIIKREYQNLSIDQFMLYAATDVGGLLIDGFGDGIWLRSDGISPKIINNTSFNILQATRTRISKTEYISCPSCGRTLFDLQETTAMIRNQTNHLKGVKIGIMGCIVNGPGEMADADYGYVGSGPGKITLYKGKEVVKKNIPSEKALDELINLIKEDGNWVEVPERVQG